ncbi:FAD/NAD(P)-binding domain-containing protein [Hypoxylon trugodes]|uniref:FAD/NAD(P)-binding domain-containing protein n=1 Tax=Hypoxylon trugodes TaxID=326681 RepID=UPI002199B421|nr:FAD/NAD(P)-binding domain-containing protein [Hypoxylon trugodes]KAI1384215.1 FAD/NAD(P)-binding domain-containing protein [Hypoxylon trugodes]
MEEIDYVVVGAGFHGLGAAKQLHCLQPDSSIAIFDGEPSLGGKWAENRLFQGLKSNNLLGTYEFPDFPMDGDKLGVKAGEHIPGKAVNGYLKAYAKEFGLLDFLCLQTIVLSAEHHDTETGGWTLTLKHTGIEQTSKAFARHLVIATGILSQAFIPHFEGEDRFGGKIFHSGEFGKNSDTLKAKTVTVFGAGKSGWDAVYQYAKAGVKVHWVIRSSGHGPVWMAPAYVTPFKQWIEKLANMRMLSWFSPCIWGDADGYWLIRQLYHGTAIGRSLVDRFWNVMAQDVISINKYDSHPKTALLKPWLDVMFTGCSYSILNYESDFFELVKSDRVEIHIGEITSLSPGKVHLADGTIFESEAFYLNTGWKHAPPMKFLPKGIEKELGIPHEIVDDAPTEDLANQVSLIKRADEEILNRFPRLRQQPVFNKKFIPITDQKGISFDKESQMASTPYMLHRFLIPPSPRFLRPRDIAFIGLQTNFSNITTAHISALWISAYFTGQLTIDPAKAIDDEEALAKLRYETMLHNRFGKWRYPTEWGSKGPNFVFDAVPYFDLLQRDLGLNPFRKGGFLAEIYSSYGPEDYRHITEEWLKKQKGSQMNGKARSE